MKCIKSIILASYMYIHLPFTGGFEIAFACWFVMTYRIAGNFREVQIFTIFTTHDQNAKIRTVKYKPRKFEHVNF